MKDITNEELIKKSASVINSKVINENTLGNVGCALVTDKGNVYTGVCINTSSGMGFCAEANAIGAMVTAGETKIIKIVATKKDGDGLYIYSPCGRCRQFISHFHEDNMNTDVIISKDIVVKLAELLPHYDELSKV